MEDGGSGLSQRGGALASRDNFYLDYQNACIADPFSAARPEVCAGRRPSLQPQAECLQGLVCMGTAENHLMDEELTSRVLGTPSPTVEGFEGAGS